MVAFAGLAFVHNVTAAPRIETEAQPINTAGRQPRPGTIIKLGENILFIPMQASKGDADIEA